MTGFQAVGTGHGLGGRSWDFNTCADPPTTLWGVGGRAHSLKTLNPEPYILEAWSLETLCPGLGFS